MSNNKNNEYAAASSSQALCADAAPSFRQAAQIAARMLVL